MFSISIQPLHKNKNFCTSYFCPSRGNVSVAARLVEITSYEKNKSYFLWTAAAIGLQKH